MTHDTPAEDPTTDDINHVTTMAYEVLRRLQQIDMARHPDFTHKLQQRRAVLESCIERLSDPYLNAGWPLPRRCHHRLHRAIDRYGRACRTCHHCHRQALGDSAMTVIDELKQATGLAIIEQVAPTGSTMSGRNPSIHSDYAYS